MKRYMIHGMQALTTELTALFERQKEHFRKRGHRDVAERILDLRKLKAAIEKNREGLENALYLDLKKPVHETGLSEIFPVIDEIKEAIRKLDRWMKPTRVSNPILYLGSRGEIRYEPRGVVLIISPWNFPFQLALCPVVSALAAGNCVILKPSEVSRHTSEFIGRLISEVFPLEHVAVVQGDQKVAADLLTLPFDHIFFTGSTTVGKVVMAAAAKNLTSVTLELGGKSPVIVDDTVDINEAARKIVWGKFINAGQTCVAPDYVLVPESRIDSFLESAKKWIHAGYGATDNEIKNSPDYCKIVNAKHHARLTNMLENAVRSGSQIVCGGTADADALYIAPTILTGVSNSSEIMQQEIFGPVLPVIPYAELETAFEFIHRHPTPLALYIFTDSNTRAEHILRNVPSGGTCINHVAMHFCNTNLPFGGVQQSGMGNSHGEFGFKTFSHQRGVLKVPSLNFVRLIYPPYTKRLKRLVDLTIRYLS